MFDRKTTSSNLIILNKLRSNITIVFILAQILTMISFYFVYSKLNYIYHQRLAEVMVEGVRNSTIIGDYRNTIETLNTNFNKDFNSVTLYTDGGQRIFSLPPSIFVQSKSSSGLWENISFNRVLIPIEFSDNGEKSQFGEYVFVYSRFSFFWYWGLTALITLIFGIWLFRQSKNRLISNQELIKVKEVAEARFKMARQVSHDIRSPLAALNMMLGELAQVPESKRIIIRSSVQRINDIANELLTKGKEHSISGHRDESSVVSITNDKPKREQALTVELLYPIIDTIVSEKRLQFREKQGIEIEADILNAYGLFAKINSTELKRALSNSITNAVEAFPESYGKVLLSLKSTDRAVVLTINDNGKGIPPHVLERLGQIGVTHGKDGTQSGSGLGVYHAKNTVESFGGKFQIESRENVGTKIIMTFPKVPAPKWFIEKLLIEPGTQIITLDDEISIQQVWQIRFNDIDVKHNDITLFPFTSGDEFKVWMSTFELKVNANRRIYLVDFELLNQKQNGLEIIEKLGIGRQSILVTSRYEEKVIREKCEALGIRLIPKPMAGFVPIEIKKPLEYFDAILIDDDSLVELAWNMVAKEKNKKLLYFSNPADFFDESEKFHFESPIYVDSNLGHGIKGEDVSLRISEMGFKNVNICTGYQVTDFPPMPWVRSIIGKDPIF